MENEVLSVPKRLNKVTGSLAFIQHLEYLLHTVLKTRTVHISLLTL